MKYVTEGRALKLAPSAGVRKFYDTSAEAMPDRCVKFTISTGAVDRAGDRVLQDGWVLDAFLRNPVVLWGHRDDEPPIGKCVAIGVEDGRLKAVVQFLPADMPGGFGERAEAIYRMVCTGFLSATSVGFRPLEWRATTDPDRGAHDFEPGCDFTRCELMEFSIVSTPCNSEALVEATPLLGLSDAREAEPAQAGAEDVKSASGLNSNELRERLRRQVYLLSL